MSALPCVTDWLVPGSPIRPRTSRRDHRVIAELGKCSGANPAEQFPCSAVSPAVMRSSEPSSIPRACGRRGTAGFCCTSCSFQFPGWIWLLLLDQWTESPELCRVHLCPCTSFFLLATEHSTVDLCFWVSWIPGSCSRQEAGAVLLCHAQC